MQAGLHRFSSISSKLWVPRLSSMFWALASGRIAVASSRSVHSYRVSWIFDLWHIAFVWIRGWCGRDHHPAKCFQTVTSGRIVVVTPRDTGGGTGLDLIGLRLWSWWNESPSAPCLLSAVGPIACIGWRFGQSPVLHEDHLYLVSWMVKLTGTPAHTAPIRILHWS